MSSVFPKLRPLIGEIAVIVLLACGISQRVEGAGTNTVTLSPGDNIQSAVNGAPAGTTFELEPGVYRMQSVQPKKGDIFTGTGTVVLNGSEVLSFTPVSAGSALWVAHAVASPHDGGQCQTTHPLCTYDQDLFVDGAIQTPVSSLAGLKAGEWYFDRANSKVYLPSNPGTGMAELGTSTFAFYGAASGVQIKNLTVQEYASLAQTGTVGGYKDGANWIVSQVEAKWNHGTGISLGPGGQILNSYSHNNGQMGVGIVGGANSKVIGNEISWNNYAGYTTSWEAGGSKFWMTTNLVVESNYVHDNYGNGLWTDCDNVGTLYESNTVINNAGSGILHEISYKAVITGNTVEGNSVVADSDSTLWNSQIVLANSQNVDVYGNTVQAAADGGNGIGLINEQRGTGTLGVWAAANNVVYSNTITYLGAAGTSGIMTSSGGPSAPGNRFDYNKYILAEAGSVHWAWLKPVDWTQLHAAGQELHGSTSK